MIPSLYLQDKGNGNLIKNLSVLPLEGLTEITQMTQIWPVTLSEIFILL